MMPLDGSRPPHQKRSFVDALKAVNQVIEKLWEGADPPTDSEREPNGLPDMAIGRLAEDLSYGRKDTARFPGSRDAT